MERNIYKIGKELFITSDEDIKEGDWVYHSNKNFIFQVNSNKAYSGTQNITLSFAKKYDTCKKIILTTDPDLIKDGVQAIDDEFLEWFVSKSNDSGKPIDIVEIEKEQYILQHLFKKQEYKMRYKIMLVGNGEEKLGKVLSDSLKAFSQHEGGIKHREIHLPILKEEILIPKEKPKMNKIQKEIFEMEQELGVPSYLRWYNSKPKQETLEEAANKANGYNLYAKDTKGQAFYEGFISGANWQAKIMYSEEDVVLIIEKFRDLKMIAFSEWFEQFKKK